MFDFDPLYSTSQIEAIERFIDKHYVLGSPVSCQLLQRGLNDVYLASVTSSERYVFRLSHHRARGPANVKSETAFLTHLSKLGVPVAAPIPTRDGTFFLQGHAPEGARDGVLFQAINGREPLATDTGDAWANGKTLGGALYRLDLEHLLHRPLARIRDSGIVEDAHVLSDLGQIAERTATAIKAFSNLTWTYCHGDCHGFNSRINGAGEAVFFDFDDGGPGYLASDLAVFLWAQVSFGRSLTAMWAAFVDGYQSIRPITPDDFEGAIRFVIVRHFWLMGEYASRAREWGSNSVGWIAREVTFLRTWETERFVGRLF
ncbi:phosphotransferase [Sinorhizobium sp. BJ1]|uniref:phosphotransferase enzyme family protein n=1 Tax=Sinorhizobium sp. BJ1 TaxID=2035455 RepID=UPI000BEA7CF7|nr:phosphotransferase [Sinorhizobium sp. BJ1]PDT81788.1 kinase [Sinorhizobium sp. BJ1]